MGEHGWTWVNMGEQEFEECYITYLGTNHLIMLNRQNVEQDTLLRNTPRSINKAVTLL